MHGARHFLVATVLGLAAPLASCGRVRTDDTVASDDPKTMASSGGDSATGAEAGDPAATSSLLGDPGRDPIFSYPELAPGVTSVVQPSYFAPAGDGGMTVGNAGDGGVSLSGTGDLTVLLVFDKSSSMLFDWDGKTRWQVANESLRSALDGILDILTIGVIRFPLDESCAVPELDSGSQIEFTTGRHFVELWQSMEHRLESLGTPLGEAIRVAGRAIDQARGKGRLDGRFRVVLVTDGEPNCGETLGAMTGLVAGWYGEGIETLIIGLPGSDAGAFTLNALAEAGGTGTVTMTSTGDELGGELNQALR
jgi:hypothetical protein